MNRLSFSVPILVLSAAVLVSTGCFRPTPTGDFASATRPEAAIDPTATTWSEIEHYDFNQRMRFSAGLERMVKTKEAEFESLRVQLRDLPINRSAQLKTDEHRFREIRIDLRLQLARLRVSSVDAWQDQKSICVQSWHRLQEAFTALESNGFPPTSPRPTR